MVLAIKDVTAKVARLEATYSDRDGRMARVRAVRSGRMGEVFPHFFNDEISSPMVANFVDVVARDLSEVIAPMPALNCASGNISSDRAKKFAAKRQRAGIHYWLYSNLKLQMTTAADHYVMDGFAPCIVEPDFQESTPRIRFLDTVGSYPEFDARGECVSFCRKFKVKTSQLANEYPDLATSILKKNQFGQFSDTDVTVYRYMDAHQTLVYVKERNDLVLERFENRLGECPVVVAVRPSYDENMRGQFDDILGVQAARALLMRLSLEAYEKNVQAPIAAPEDVQEINIGPDAIMRSATPEKIGRVDLSVKGNEMMESQALQEELRMGSRYPDARSGDVKGSIVTGRGVEALMGGFDTQVKQAQMVFGECLRKITRLCFKLDETYWPNKTKTIRGIAEGTPFEQDYTPSKDIAGDYTCDVTYGMLAGMDPSRGLVFMLQALGAGLVDKGTVQRQMPWDIDVTQLQQNIEIERLREAGLQGILALSSSIGQLIQQGGDANSILAALGKSIQDRQKGKSIEDCLMNFTPPPPPQPSPEEQAEGEGGPGGPPGMPGQGGPPGLGGPGGTPVGQEGMTPGGRPTLQMLMSKLSAGAPAGAPPNMSAGTRRQVASIS